MPQQEAMWNCLKGGSWQLVAEVIEVESGTPSDRPTRQETLHGATLILPSLRSPVMLLQGLRAAVARAAAEPAQCRGLERTMVLLPPRSVAPCWPQLTMLP